MKLIKLKCENCGAKLEVNSELDNITCNFCGAKIFIDDKASELRRVEEVKLKARKENHERDLIERQERLEQELKEKEILEKANAKDNFKKSKLSKVLLIFFALSVMFIFSSSSFISKLFAIIQAGLFITSYLMGMEIINEPKKGLRTILIIAAFVMIIPIGTLNSNTSYEKEYDTINWEYIVLKDHLPTIKSNEGNLITNSDDKLVIYIKVESEADYRKYIEECKEYGFNIDSKTDTYSYKAKNENGDELELSYYGGISNDLDISLKINKVDYK